MSDRQIKFEGFAGMFCCRYWRKAWETRTDTDRLAAHCIRRQKRKKAKLLKNETGAVTWFYNQPVNRSSFKNQTLCPMPRALALIWWSTGDRKVPHVFCHQVYVLDHLLLQGCISVSSHADLPFTLCSPDPSLARIK